MDEIAMARKPNPIKSHVLTVTLNNRTAWYLDRLIETGVYGNTHSQAVAVAVYDHCKLLTAQGKLPEIPPMAGSTAIEVSPKP
jgi:hypothetical protein